MATSTVEPRDSRTLYIDRVGWHCPPHESPLQTDEDGSLTACPSTALSGARAAILAIGLEAVAVLGIYGLSHLWRLVR